MNLAALALSSILAGAAAGTVLSTLFLWLSLRNWHLVHAIGDPGTLMFAGNILAPVAALLACWNLSKGVAETWRRAAMAVTAAFGALAASGAGMALSLYAGIDGDGAVKRALLPAYLLLALAVWLVAVRAVHRQRSMGARSQPSSAP